MAVILTPIVLMVVGIPGGTFTYVVRMSKVGESSEPIHNLTSHAWDSYIS